MSYRKDDRAMCPIYECPKNFRQSLSTPITATFHALVIQRTFSINEVAGTPGSVDVKCFTLLIY